MKPLFDYLYKHKRRVATLALIFGFIVDIITFRNLDLTLSQIILAAHLTIVGGSLMILAMPAKGGRFFSFMQSWLPVALQYSTGNLLSAFLVLYSGSGSLLQSWPFFALLVIAAFGNEVFKSEKRLLPFRTTLFFLNLLLFFALAVPVFVKSIGVMPFVLSLAVSSSVFVVYILLARFLVRGVFKESFARIQKNAFTILCTFVLLYVTNLIPPIPLSIKDHGFFHDVYSENGTYVGVDEKREWHERFFSLSGDTLRLTAGEPAFLYSAVFAPAKLSTAIAHRWQRYDPEFGEWQTENLVTFPIVGGRDGGYRGYSFTENPEAGKWRVIIETKRGQVIGRVYFMVEHVSTPVPLIQKILE